MTEITAWADHRAKVTLEPIVAVRRAALGIFPAPG